MTSLFAGLLLLIASAAIGIYFVSRLRVLQAAETVAPPANVAGRYRPMLRLLAEDDFRFVSADPRLRNKLRGERRKLFRIYLRCLARDYGRLLQGVRLAMVQARVDRPDLAKALAKNRTLFALALCKVEFGLALHAAGIGKVEISGLVDALDALRSQVAVFSAAPALAAN